jgi:hypothetical protein
VALLATGWVLAWVLAGRRRLLTARPLPAGARVSVIVPARDEAERLPRLLGALAAASPAPLEVLVVDDGSTDGTAAVARSAGATVVPASRPPGWSGKAHACHRGAEVARGDVLVFLDADVEPAPAAVAALAAAAVERDGLVSAHPVHRVERAYERLSAGAAVVALLGAGTGGPPAHRWWRRPFAFGPALAVPADAYGRLGGHAAVRAAVADDVALAAAADRHGVGATTLLAGPLASYRMYPAGVAQLVEGWTKNLATGGAATPPLRAAAVAVWVTAVLESGVVLAGGLASGGGALAAATAAYLLFAVQFHVVSRRIGRFGVATSALHPLVLAAFVALFAWSAVLTFGRGRVRWRGRSLDLRRAP